METIMDNYGDNMTKLFNYILLVGTPTPIVNINESMVPPPTLLITFRLARKPFEIEDS